MKILALQLKRIGDLVLTAPALHDLKAHGADVTVAIDRGGAGLLGAFPCIDAGVIFGKMRGWAPWQQALTGGFDAVLDFTGTDRSAAAALLSHAPQRLGFAWVQEKHRLRAAAYRELVDSAVRDFHTVDHYRHLSAAWIGKEKKFTSDALPPPFSVPEKVREAVRKRMSEVGIEGPFILCHPGTARPEKYWLSERWGEVISHLRSQGRHCVLTGGTKAEERAHLGHISQSAGDRGTLPGKLAIFSGSLNLLELAAMAGEADLVISCDTAMVHIAAALERPQIALFGPTNPFHWRPRHPHAVVLSATQPEAPLTEFTPRMKGAPMTRLEAPAVLQAAASLLSSHF